MIINTMKTIEETMRMINLRYDMTSKNITDIVNNASNRFEEITYSFIFGYAQGMKAQKAAMKKKTKEMQL